LEKIEKPIQCPTKYITGWRGSSNTFSRELLVGISNLDLKNKTILPCLRLITGFKLAYPKLARTQITIYPAQDYRKYIPV
jgi:hypothetical protein